jgi:hypothetical protein
MAWVSLRVKEVVRESVHLSVAAGLRLYDCWDEPLGAQPAVFGFLASSHR